MGGAQRRARHAGTKQRSGADGPPRRQAAAAASPCRRQSTVVARRPLQKRWVAVPGMAPAKRRTARRRDHVPPTMLAGRSVHDGARAGGSNAAYTLAPPAGKGLLSTSD